MAAREQLRHVHEGQQAFPKASKRPSRQRQREPGPGKPGGPRPRPEAMHDR